MNRLDSRWYDGHEWHEPERTPMELESGQRISHAERREAQKFLGECFTQGRLDDAEYLHRTERLEAAVYASDLSYLVRDLPTPGPAGTRVTKFCGDHDAALAVLWIMLGLLTGFVGSAVAYFTPGGSVTDLAMMGLSVSGFLGAISGLIYAMNKWG